MSSDPATQVPPAVLISTGSTCVLLGAFALLGWYCRVPALARLVPSSSPMAFNSAAGFVLDGLALLSIAAGRPAGALAGAGWSLLAGVLTLAQYLFSVELKIDEILMPNAIRPLPGTPNHVAPNSAVCFVLCGAALFCLSRSRFHGRSTAISGVLGAVALALGATSVFGYLAGYPTYVWGPWTQMAANSGIGFVALGIGIVGRAWQYDARNAAAPQRWLAPAAGCGAFTVVLGLSYALARDSGSHPGQDIAQGVLPFAPLVSGALRGTILGFMVYLALNHKRRAEAMQLANRELEREVAERRRAEQRLLASEERFRSAFEEAPFGMLLAALDGRLFQVNKTFCQLLGRSEQDLLGGSWKEFTHPEDLSASHSAADQLLRGPDSFVEFETRYIGSRGNLIWARLRISLLRDSDGKPSHFVTHIEDITDRKRAETELRNREERFRNAFEHAPFGMCLAGRDRRLLQVNATLCHMLGFSEEELLARGWDEITRPEDVPLSREALVRLERELLPFVEYETRYLNSMGHIVWVRVRVSMAADAAEGWHHVAQIEDITERKRAEEAIRASEDRVRLLLDSTAEAIYGIDLDGNCTFANPACLRLLGYGDSQEVVGRNMHNLIHHRHADGSPHAVEECRIFRAFQEGKGSHAGLHGTAVLLMAPLGEHGAAMLPQTSGFAACVSKPILEARLHDALASALGRRTAPEPGIAALPMPRRPVLAQKHARILLAEDNPVNREVALAILGQLGFTADPVFDGTQAVKALQNTAYDLVLMDCEMPEMDGYEATRRIRDPQTAAVNPRTPIVAVTASAMPGDRERCLRAGMDDYLAKPIEPDELAQVLAKWLGRAKNNGDPGLSGAAPPVPVESVFDETGLLKRLMGNRALAERLVREFLHDIPLQLEMLRKQLEDGDAPSARRQAHTVKGSAANLSAGALRAVALRAEQAATAGQLSHLAEILPSVEREFERVKDAMGRSGWT